VCVYEREREREGGVDEKAKCAVFSNVASTCSAGDDNVQQRPDIRLRDLGPGRRVKVLSQVLACTQYHRDGIDRAREEGNKANRSEGRGYQISE